MRTRFVIEEDDAERLIQRYDQQDEDPLDLRVRCGDTNAKVARFCGELLAGRIETPTGIPVAQIDNVAAHMLALLGIHPGAAAAIAEAARGIGIVIGHEDEPRAFVFAPVDRGTIESTDIRFDGLRWIHGTLHAPALPDTVLNAINALDESPPLRRVVSHHRLDLLDLNILSMERPRPYDSTSISLDNHVAPLTREQLDAVWAAALRNGVVNEL